MKTQEQASSRKHPRTRNEGGRTEEDDAITGGFANVSMRKKFNIRAFNLKTMF